jgi:hypothetical protein
MWSQGGRTYLIVTRGRPEGFDAVASYIRLNVK